MSSDFIQKINKVTAYNPNIFVGLEDKSRQGIKDYVRTGYLEKDEDIEFILNKFWDMLEEEEQWLSTNFPKAYNVFKKKFKTLPLTLRLSPILEKTDNLMPLERNITRYGYIGGMPNIHEIIWSPWSIYYHENQKEPEKELLEKWVREEYPKFNNKNLKFLCSVNFGVYADIIQYMTHFNYAPYSDHIKEFGLFKEREIFNKYYMIFVPYTYDENGNYNDENYYDNAFNVYAHKFSIYEHRDIMQHDFDYVSLSKEFDFNKECYIIKDWEMSLDYDIIDDELYESQYLTKSDIEIIYDMCEDEDLFEERRFKGKYTGKYQFFGTPYDETRYFNVRNYDFPLRLSPFLNYPDKYCTRQIHLDTQFRQVYGNMGIIKECR